MNVQAPAVNFPNTRLTAERTGRFSGQVFTPQDAFESGKKFARPVIEPVKNLYQYLKYFYHSLVFLS